MARSLSCPFCWESIREQNLERRCPEECGLAEDPQLTAFLERPTGRAEMRPKSFKVSAAKGKGLCPHGRRAPQMQICPSCHNDLEHDYVRSAGRSRPIALIGASGSGKSVYVGVLVRELRTRVGSDFDGLAVEFVGDSSRSHYDKVFRVPLFEEGVTLRMTDSIRVNRRLEPLLFTLKFTSRQRRLRDRLDLAMMVFLDTSGEDVLRAEAMSRLARYLDAAAGIVLVVDPLQMPDVREAVTTTVYPQQATRQVDVVERLGALLRQQRGLGPDKRLDTPLAVLLSKIDTLEAILPDQSSLSRHAEHAGYYDEADGLLVDQEVRSWIHRWYGEGFVNSVDANFSTSRFFGMSALGTAPSTDRKVDRAGIRPRRVEDPLLWLLARFGMVRRGLKR
ncbi:TRAFAC clade GTPase domain-containing protein [Parafrankia sp. FMc2]|uniref:TRAFAC clade GTPase domain-containing protein n=1 Tax=Parafrankia sp. FMc2 TaxID=3233196 RepID=UPI0034D64107